MKHSTLIQMINRAVSHIFFAALALWVAPGAQAAVLTFDDLPAFSTPSEQYSSLGVHLYFSNTGSVQPGLSNGDPNGWGVDGAPGPYFFGVENPGTLSLLFDAPIASFSLDAIRPPTTTGDAELTLYCYQNGAYTSQTVNLLKGGPWTNITFNVAPTSGINWYSISGGRYGIDNLRFTLAEGTGAPIIYSLYSKTFYAGSESILSVQVVGGKQPLQFQWYFKGAPVAGATNSSLWFPITQPSQAGNYSVIVSNELGQASSSAGLILVSSAPAFVNNPYSQSVYADGYAVFNCSVTGYPYVNFQWQYNETNILGATNSYLQLARVQLNQAGPYRVIATNPSGSATSLVATLTVLTLAPTLYALPQSQTVSAGSHVVLDAYAFGAPWPDFQWYFHGTPIPGEIKDVLKLYNVSSNNNGTYTLVASNIAGFTNTSRTLTVVPENTLDHWTWENPSPQGNELSGIVYAPNLFVTVGRYGTILSSPDGTTWTSRTSHTRNHLYSIAHGNGRFVAVGSAGEVLTSTDASNWVRQASGTPHNLYAVTFANSQFMAVGRFGTILTSPNGVSWTPQNSGTTNHLRGVAYDLGQYVAVGSKAEIVTSPDANTWTRHPTGEWRNFRAVASGNSAFVAVGNGGLVMRSTDGLDWSPAALSYSTGLRSVAFVNGTFIATAQYGNLFTSTDGLSWTIYPSAAYDSLHDLAKGGGQLVAVGDYGTLLLNTNAMQWVDQRLGRGISFADSAFGSGRFLAVSPYPGPDSLWISPDGRAWTRTNVSDSMTLNTALFAQGKFLVGGTDYSTNANYRSIWTSTDTTNWTAHTLDMPNVTDLAYGNGSFIAVGNGSNNVAWSTNGESWNCASVWNGAQFSQVTAGNGVFVALANYSSFFVSSNGLDWAQSSPDMYSIPASVTFGNGLFVAVGYRYADNYGPRCFTSTDALTWTEYPISEYTYRVSYVNGWFFALGDDPGFILSSRDGVNWVRRNTPSEAFIDTVAYGQHTYVASGWSTILRAEELAFDSLAINPPSSHCELVFNGEPGQVYRVQWSTDLLQWFDLASVTNTQPRMTFHDPNATPPAQRFYRMITP